MRPAEQGFLLLTSTLGNPERKPLTTAQLRKLAQRVRSYDAPQELRELEPRDLIRLGYGPDEAQRIVSLLEEEELLRRYLRKAEAAGCAVLTRVSEGYPLILRRRLGDDAPGCLWYKGDPELLSQPLIGLVGSRDLLPENRHFARQAGIQAALQGFTLVSGNARGADQTGQNGCLEAGGCVVSVVADELYARSPAANILYLSEDGFDLEFSPQRALSRNRVIHALGRCTFVAQSALEHGGSWDGTIRNLRSGWSPVYCFDDGSQSACALEQRGASLIQVSDLEHITALAIPPRTLFDL